MTALTRLWHSVFPSRAERERDVVLESLNRRLASAQRKVREAYDYADGLVSDWERERELMRREPGYRGDRRYGDNWPYLTNMEDLRHYRGLSRAACEGNGYGVGFLDRAVDFIVGDGMQPQVTLKGSAKGAVSTGVADADGDGEPDADERVQAVQQVIDEFRELNDWGMGEEDREEEGFRRSQRDGEVFVRFFRGGSDTNGIPRVRWGEPEQVDAPPGALPNERWGIRYKKDDVETKEAAYFYDLETGTTGEWVDWDELVHHKLGTDRTVLRGMPQFWLVATALSQCEKLNSAVTEVSAIQAQIAYVREHAPGILPGQINTFVGALPDGTERKPTPHGDRYRRVGYGENGTVVDMSNGMKFNAGPVSQGVPGFIQALQSRLRQVCARFGYPEFFTGDASNGNYASLLAAGGPAEKAFKRRQQRYASFQAAVYKRACQYAVKAGRLKEDELAACEITVTPGKVSVSDPLEEAQVDQILIDSKVKSVQRAMMERGYDPRVETANIEAWAAKFEQQQGLEGQEQEGEGGDEDMQADDGELLDPSEDEGFAESVVSESGVILSCSEVFFESLTEAQRNLLIKQVKTDKNGRKVTRWVRAGGVMGGPDERVQKAQMIKPGRGVTKPTGGAAKSNPSKPAPKGKAKSASKATGKASPKTPDQLGYLPKDPKHLTVAQADKALTDMGYEVHGRSGGGSQEEPHTLTVKDPQGKVQHLKPAGVKQVLYGDQEKKGTGKDNSNQPAKVDHSAEADRLHKMADEYEKQAQDATDDKDKRAAKVLGAAAKALRYQAELHQQMLGALAALRPLPESQEGDDDTLTESEYAVLLAETALLSEADRSHLVPTKITVQGKYGPYQRTVLKRVEPAGGKGQAKRNTREQAKVTARELIAKGVKTPTQARQLAESLKQLRGADVDELKREFQARTGGKLKQDKVDRLVAYAQGRGSVGGAKATAPANPASHPEAREFVHQQARRLVSAWTDAVRLGKGEAAHALEVVMGNMSAMKQVGEPGETLPFNPAHHSSGTAASTGHPVEVERPGWVLHEPDGTEYVVAKAVVRPPGSKPAAKPLLAHSDDEIAAKVHDTAKAQEYGFSDNKVFISDVFGAMKKQHPELSEEEFKQKLLDLNAAGKVHLSRADEVPTMDETSVRRSQTDHPYGARFHFVNLTDVPGGVRTRKNRKGAGG